MSARMDMQLVEGPAALDLALAGGRLEQAMSRSDMVEVLVAASELDRMVRALGPAAESERDRAALLRAHDLVGSVLNRLEAEMSRGQTDRRRTSRLRLAYCVTDAA